MEEKEFNELVAKIEKAAGEKISEEVKEALKGVDTETLKELANKDLATKDDLKELVKTSDIEELKTLVEEATEKANQAIESQTAGAEKDTFIDSIKKSLLANVDSLKAMKDDPNQKVTIKAAVAMTFATNTTGNVGRTERETGWADTLRRTPILLDIVNTSSTNARNYEWVEKSGRDGGVAMVAEGAVKPQGDWDLELFSQQPKKEAIIVTVSKEMLDDIDGMARDIQEEVYEQLRLFTESIVLNGDGTGNNIVGLDANATAFVAGDLSNTVLVANEHDAIRAAINQVELSNDFPTAVLMHPTDATKMELVKDASTSQYVLPPFTSIDGTKIKGLPVRTSTLVTSGEAYVGNFKRFKVKIREDIEFVMGYRGAAGDWEKNMVSFLGEERLFGFIPAVHYGSIVKLDLAVAKALLDPNVADS